MWNARDRQGWALAASFATGAVVFAVVILLGLVVIALSARGGKRAPLARL